MLEHASEDLDFLSNQGECIDGEINNDNPCNPIECWEGEWIEIIIDCAEQMGVPCEEGVYLPPLDGVCCSTCVQYGDINSYRRPQRISMMATPEDNIVPGDEGKNINYRGF